MTPARPPYSIGIAQKLERGRLADATGERRGGHLIWIGQPC
jgi:hypothetical protein